MGNRSFTDGSLIYDTAIDGKSSRNENPEIQKEIETLRKIANLDNEGFLIKIRKLAEAIIRKKMKELKIDSLNG